MHDAEADQGRQGWENLVVRTAPQFLFKSNDSGFPHEASGRLVEPLPKHLSI